MTDLVRLLKAIKFASERHSTQCRKDVARTPYINHPIAVAELVARYHPESHVNDILGAILHDTVEDTCTTPEELEQLFGLAVVATVETLTDDKGLAADDRKLLQVRHAATLPVASKRIKIADKICNVTDISATSPVTWGTARKLAYVEFAENVVCACGPSASPELTDLFIEVAAEKRTMLKMLYPL